MRSRDGKDIWPFFEPGSIAVFGSFKEPIGLGCGVIKNIIDFGFKGQIYPVNPLYDEVLGLHVYSTFDEIDKPVDLVVVITPAPTVPDIVDKCARKGTKAAIVVSEHFAEANQEGAGLQRQLVDIASRTGIRIMGPNTVGTLNTANGLITNPYQIGYSSVRRGGIAYCSQTGIAATQCQPLEDLGYPISKMCDTGNKCDVNEVDILHYLVDDPETKVVSMHLEDVRDGHGFMNAALKFTAHKPLLIFKSARSSEGARASASHTGSLAGNDEIYDSAIKQAGAFRVENWHEFWEMPKVFMPQRLSTGNRIAIIAYSGGSGVSAADTAIKAGLAVTEFSHRTIGRLKRLGSRAARNPMDLGPILSASDDPVTVQREAITAVLEDPNVDCVNIAVYVGVLAPIEYVTELISGLVCNTSKPVTVWLYGTKLDVIRETSHHLEGLGLPTYTELETAIKALGMLADYSKFRSNL
jgi:acetyltransferase